MENEHLIWHVRSNVDASASETVPSQLTYLSHLQPYGLVVSVINLPRDIWQPLREFGGYCLVHESLGLYIGIRCSQIDLQTHWLNRIDLAY
jgi:hypothetical protein